MGVLSVIVIGSIHHNTLGVIRSLGEAGIPRDTIDVLIVAKEHNTKNLISSSRYVSKKRIAFVNDCSEIVHWLKNHSDFDENKVIICCSDGASEAVIKERDILKDKYKTPSSVIDITKLMQKSYQDEIAADCGLNVPIWKEILTCDNVEWNCFPCIVKPSKSSIGGGKNDIHIVYCKEELKAIIKTIQSSHIQIQEYIEKTMEFQLIGCSLDAGKMIIVPGFTNIIRQPSNTNTGYLQYSPINRLDFDLGRVESFIKKIGYSGLFSIEFIRGKDGNDYFLEINMRNDGNAYCVESAGINLPYIWAFYQVYGKLPDVPTSFYESIYFIPDFNDLKIAIKKVGPIKWLKQFKHAQSHSIFNTRDMKPFTYEFFRQCKRYVKLVIYSH